MVSCALISGLITLLMAFYTNFPFALSTGMGSNFLLGTLIQSQQLSFGAAMAITLISGIVFVLPRSLNPDSLGRTVTFYTWTILLLGGAATIMGPILGSCVLWVLLTAVKETMRVSIPPTVISSNQIEALGWIIVGVALMLLVIFRPQGILGNKKELAFNG